MEEAGKKHRMSWRKLARSTECHGGSWGRNTELKGGSLDRNRE
jgi:hypothetical protein